MSEGGFGQRREWRREGVDKGRAGRRRGEGVEERVDVGSGAGTKMSPGEVWRRPVGTAVDVAVWAGGR